MAFRAAAKAVVDCLECSAWPKPHPFKTPKRLLKPGKACLENHGLIAIKKDAVFHVPANGAGKDDLFKVAAFSNQIIDGVAVRDADHVLLDDGTVVENFGNVVAGCADQLYAALEGLMVRARADERGQKRMVNVDDALRIAADEIIGEDLHVAGEDDEVGFVRLDQRVDILFRLWLIVFRDWDHGVGNFVEVGDSLIVRMIGNDERDVAGEFAALVTVEEIDEAVVVFRDQNDHAGPMRRLRQTPFQLELFGDGREVFAEGGEIFVGEIDVEVLGIELDSHQEESGLFVGMFVGVQDVAAVAVDEVGDGGDFAFGVGAGD